jgi:glycerol uptake facilitator-like aquaporin
VCSSSGLRLGRVPVRGLEADVGTEGGEPWLFWLAPILGAAVGALIYRFLREEKGEEKG